MNMTLNSNCPKCQGKGFYMEMRDGYEYAINCECMAEARAQERIDRLLSRSGIRPDEYAKKSFDTFKADTDSAKKMLAMAEKYIANIKTADSCGFFGNSGTGKTHICIAICQEITRKFKIPHKYFSYRSEVQRFKSIFFKEEYHEEIRKVIEEPFLYIDDFLKFAQKRDGSTNNQELQIAYEIVNGRYLNRGKTIFSSEYTISEMRKIDEALASRVYEMVGEYGLKCDGKNRRFNNGK